MARRRTRTDTLIDALVLGLVAVLLVASAYHVTSYAIELGERLPTVVALAVSLDVAAFVGAVAHMREERGGALALFCAALGLSLVLNIAGVWGDTARVFVHAIPPALLAGVLHVRMRALLTRADKRTRARSPRADTHAHTQPTAHASRTETTRTRTTTTETETTRTDALELVADDARSHTRAWLDADDARSLRDPALVTHLAAQLSVSPSQARRYLQPARAALNGDSR